MNEIGSSYSVTDAYSADSAREATAREGDALGKEDFLRLLVTELKTQDPLQPMMDREFLAQLAQFTSLEEISNLREEETDRGSRLDALLMLGRWVRAGAGDDEQVEGVVTGVSFADGSVALRIGEAAVAPGDVIEVLA